MGTATTMNWTQITQLQLDADGDNWDAAQEAVQRLFKYQPWDKEQEHAGNEVRDALVSAFTTILAHVPPSPTRTAALRKIYEARMDANAAITHRGNV